MQQAGRRFYLAVCSLILAGCTVVPVPMDSAERDRLASEARARLFSNQDAPSASVGLAEATARSIKYYADLRAKTLEQAASEAQLGVAQFDLLPRLTANAGYSTRDNEAFGFGFTPGGTVGTNPSASVERTRDTQSVGFAWNVLDFGVSYFRARQLADQTLIAQERRRKAVQTLVHDVRQAWWRAEAAQRLLPEIDSQLDEIESALERTRAIEARRLLPPMQIVAQRRALLDLEQQISFRRQELAQAQVEFAALINVPPGTVVRLNAQPPENRRVYDLTADVNKLEEAALRNRPEMAEEGYRARVSEGEARKALVQILPGISFDVTSNYDSNRYLVNNTWTSAGINVAFNLVKAFSLPALGRSEAAQKAADEARRLAMAMAILAQTRISAVRYTLVAHEYGVWESAARDDEKVVELLIASAEVGIDSELELIRAKARAMVSRISRDLAYANLEASVARVLNSVGYDAVDRDQDQLGVVELTQRLDLRLAEMQRDVFSPRVPDSAPKLTIAAVTGMDRASVALLSEGINRVFRDVKLQVVDPDKADLRILVQAVVRPPREGVRAASVNVRVVDVLSGDEKFVSDFKTTLSEPVDDEQLRVLGEGAAYRLAGWLSGSRWARKAANSGTGKEGSKWGSEAPMNDVPARRAHLLDGGYLSLRLESDLQSESRSAVSRLKSSEQHP
jgi:outer membrane protein TolC